VERVEGFRFLGVHITGSTAAPSRASWPVASLPTLWYGNCSASDPKALQRVGSANGPVHHWGLASCHPGPIYRRCQRKDHKIVRDSSHPSHRLFSLLPHGKRYRSAKSRT
jgi:hypothetical protein